MMKLFRREKKITVLTPLEGYNRWASTYQHEDNPIKNLSDALIERWLPPLDNKNFLDAGCGTGKFCMLAEKQKAAAVHGLDLSPEMIHQSKSNCSTGTFECGDLTQLTMPSGTFDVIVCALVLGHIEDLKTALGHLLGALKPGGSILITDFHPFLTLQRSKRTFRDKISGDTFEVQHHLHLFQDYFKIFQEYGVKVDLLEEPFFRDTPVIFGIRAQKL